MNRGHVDRVGGVLRRVKRRNDGLMAWQQSRGLFGPGDRRRVAGRHPIRGCGKLRQWAQSRAVVTWSQRPASTAWPTDDTTDATAADWRIPSCPQAKGDLSRGYCWSSLWRRPVVLVGAWDERRADSQQRTLCRSAEQKSTCRQTRGPR